MDLWMPCPELSLGSGATVRIVCFMIVCVQVVTTTVSKLQILEQLFVTVRIALCWQKIYQKH